jgi:hypothetical protein
VRRIWPPARGGSGRLLAVVAGRAGVEPAPAAHERDESGRPRCAHRLRDLRRGAGIAAGGAGVRPDGEQRALRRTPHEHHERDDDTLTLTNEASDSPLPSPSSTAFRATAP